MHGLCAISAAALLILQVAASSEDIAARDNALAPGKAVMEDSNRFNRSTIGAVALDGRALIAKWLNPVALEKRACTGNYKASCGGKSQDFS